MRRGVLNAYNLQKKTFFFKKYERCGLIIKYILSSSRVSHKDQLIASFKKWGLKKRACVSNQTAVCKRGGGFKRVIGLLGYNRHMTRQLLNVKRVPIIKKMSW